MSCCRRCRTSHRGRCRCPWDSDTLSRGSTTNRNSSRTTQVRRPYDPSIMYASNSGSENDMGVKYRFALDHMN
ncbi:hypothetical protein E2562_038014 [Oryza meyeriana var. granulata]|uniref:Uncharacterized protein n=1 Tax=Oryza meyeriana var. granulata TaxID=110450 RepID=A0A6G1BZQ4_9ORYZ|nr:hypothetical protein E2562_023209 [Oryza meyeriana var. granulata]KAF0930937.1 hypothetical protein E2562_038014 [Oryza meyeriana var. granulata]